jgi:hypothetical protein
MAALASYAWQSEDRELELYARRIRDRAVRREGEILQQIAPARGANQNISQVGLAKVLTRRDAAAEAGLSRHQRNTALRVARTFPD